MIDIKLITNSNNVDRKFIATYDLISNLFTLQYTSSCAFIQIVDPSTTSTVVKAGNYLETVIPIASTESTLQAYALDEDKNLIYSEDVFLAPDAVCWGDIQCDIHNQTDLIDFFDLKFDKAGGTITGETTIEADATINGMLSLYKEMKVKSVDPATLGKPPADQFYLGIVKTGDKSKLWFKDDTGTVIYAPLSYDAEKLKQKVFTVNDAGRTHFAISADPQVEPIIGDPIVTVNGNSVSDADFIVGTNSVDFNSGLAVGDVVMIFYITKV